jgi:UDP-N-acetyl-2-amino-2-deoxyglucuronate dehydrogenase
MTEQRPVGVGIVGTGLSATQHLTALKDVPNGRAVAVAGTSLAKAREIADKWGIERAYGSYGELVRDPAVEAVHVCTPPNVRAEVARAAAAAGKHILVEKPMGRTAAEADQVIAACDAAGVQLAAMFQNRFTPLARAARAAVAEGKLGRLLLVTLSSKWYRTAEYYAQGSGWRGTAAGEGGAALISQAIHAIDLMLWICGDVAEVTALTATTVQPIEMEDVGLALLRFESGAVGSLVGTTVAYPGFAERLELHGSEGSLLLAQGEGRLEWHLKGQEPTVQTASEQVSAGSRDAASISYFGHSAEFTDFYAAIREGRGPFIPGREGRRAVELVEAIYRSGRERRPVRLRD